MGCDHPVFPNAALNAGSNTIMFSTNAAGVWAPDFDKISVKQSAEVGEDDWRVQRLICRAGRFARSGKLGRHSENISQRATNGMEKSAGEL